MTTQYTLPDSPERDRFSRSSKLREQAPEVQRRINTLGAAVHNVLEEPGLIEAQEVTTTPEPTLLPVDRVSNAPFTPIDQPDKLGKSALLAEAYQNISQAWGDK